MGNVLRAEQPAAAEALAPAGAEAAPSVSSLSEVYWHSHVLDLQSLWDIAEDTGSPALAVQFLSDFLSLLQGRLSRLLAVLAAEDPAASMDAVLSLQRASAMAGATEIAGRCASILTLVATRHFACARVQAAALQRDVDVLTAASPMLLEQAQARLGGEPAAGALA
ncbi:Hpt domain-containing protein [Pseudarthrobacter sp. NPDC080039]|uniref:Hpt domain-containing protein n=1 Tax=unclassified Pseudarthrobacter TaxID=2647000 RepID=UPI00344DF2F1